ncbi:MAG: sulfotransferase [Nocardioides sp.]
MNMKAHRRARRMAALEAAEASVPISFAIVGVQKGATTTLYRMLAKHPDVVRGPEPEMRFFIQRHDWSAPDYTSYRRPVIKGGHVAGDATPAYLFWPGALHRIRDYDPGMRLMAIFRDPVERAFSQWAMERGRRPSYPDLPVAIEKYLDKPLPPEGSEHPSLRQLRRSLFARSLYGEQLERALPLFPAEQWRLFEFRAFLSDPHTQIDRATDLLGLPRFDRYPRLPHRNPTPVVRGEPPSLAAFERLVRRYADDLPVFERLSQIDTSAWPTRQVLDGTLELEAFHARICAKLDR